MMSSTSVKPEEASKDTTKPVGVSSTNDSLSTVGRESREEAPGKRDQPMDEREDHSESKAKSSSSRSKSGNAAQSKKGGRFNYPHNNNSNNNKMAPRGPYNNPMMRGGPPYGPPPYGFMSNSYGPPPPHYPHPPHMPMPPYAGAPFPGQMGGPGMNGSGMNGPGMNGPGMKGPGYPHHHYHGPPYGMPPAYPQHVPSSYPHMGASSDSASITSKSSMNSKKKRTIDGMHGNLPSAYTFRRTDSNSSSASTLTTGNNTSMETNQTDESQHTTRDGSDSVSLNMDGMAFEDRYNHEQSNSQSSFHRRNHSVASTASSLSVCGFSLSSYEGQRGASDDATRASIKRHKRNDRAPLVVDTGSGQSNSSRAIDAEQSNRFGQLSIENKGPSSGTSAASSEGGRNIFLALSTSPINAGADVDATPLKTNLTSKRDSAFKTSKKPSKEPDRPSDTPTPPVHGELGETEANDDHSMLNRHLRGQSFTPLPHLSSSDNPNGSPSNAAFSAGIAPQLSWSIAGDTPSLGDLADWEEENGKIKTETKARPSSTTSIESRTMPISPHDFHMWKEEHELADNGASGTTTPLPMFFEQTSNEGTENQGRSHSHPSKKMGSYNDTHPGFVGSGSAMRGMGQEPHSMWGRHDGNMGPGPMYAGSEYRDDGFGVRSPHHSDRRDNMDFYPPYPHMGHGPNDRIRNLRGRMHPGAHMPPMPLHIPPPLSGHLPMTSPMGLGPGKNLWSPHHHGMPGSLGSPHHHMGSPLANMAQSKRKCVPLKPPIPSKFQGDIEKTKSAPVPEFTSLVNFPTHMSQKQALNLPEGMRCCVMCGQACPCSSGNKSKKAKNKNDRVPAQRNDHLGDKNSGYAIIPTQNKGLCTLCDVNVWVVVSSGLEIKWCKGCKNFRPWAAFGDKGLATKCLRCRERQREKYALQKEEKEKARAEIMAKAEG